MWFTQILSSVQQQQSLVLKCWTSKDTCRYDKDYYQFGFHVKLASHGQGDGLRNTHANRVGRYHSWHVHSTPLFSAFSGILGITPGNTIQSAHELPEPPLGIPFCLVRKLGPSCQLATQQQAVLLPTHLLGEEYEEAPDEYCTAHMIIWSSSAVTSGPKQSNNHLLTYPSA
jgi:hypothetical protein